MRDKDYLIWDTLDLKFFLERSGEELKTIEHFKQILNLEDEKISQAYYEKVLRLLQLLKEKPEDHKVLINSNCQEVLLNDAFQKLIREIVKVHDMGYDIYIVQIATEDVFIIFCTKNHKAKELISLKPIKPQLCCV